MKTDLHKDIDLLIGICKGAAKPQDGDSDYHLGYKAALTFFADSLSDILESSGEEDFE